MSPAIFDVEADGDAPHIAPVTAQASLDRSTRSRCNMPRSTRAVHGLAENRWVTTGNNK